MKVEVTNHKKVTVGTVKPGEVICINDEHYLVLSNTSSHFVRKSDTELRTMLARLDTGEVIAPVNNVYCTVVKSAKVTLTF
ncbi:hypothetical protein [Salmonella phage 7-11]|uniref:Uncharacterized protein n=1 Tax=Salmonella phage 7-11 TaxID=1054968 RepID=G0X564_9CAUD|nr:hypothetical protein SaPh711_gp131 [Salmonella phage 7-11]AEK82046.1 hypothetical protein [Salmonella phage 7-11]